MEIIFIGLTALLGALLIHQYNQRIKDQKEFSERMILEYKTGFDLGFQSSNGYKPFEEAVDPYEKEEFEIINKKSFVEQLEEQTQEEETFTGYQERW